jgi:hypothetical protein
MNEVATECALTDVHDDHASPTAVKLEAPSKKATLPLAVASKPTHTSPAVKAASRPVPTIKREPKPKSKQQQIMEQLKASMVQTKLKQKEAVSPETPSGGKYGFKVTCVTVGRRLLVLAESEVQLRP